MKPDVGNKNVDYLSRLEKEVQFASLNADFPVEHLFAISDEDDLYGEIKKYLTNQVLPEGDKYQQSFPFESSSLHYCERGSFQNGTRLQVETVCQPERVFEGTSHLPLW